MQTKAEPTLAELMTSLEYRVERLERLSTAIITMLIKGGVIIDGGTGFTEMHAYYAEMKEELNDE